MGRDTIPYPRTSKPHPIQLWTLPGMRQPQLSQVSVYVKPILTAQENSMFARGDGKVKIFPSFCPIFGIKWKEDLCCSKQNATLLHLEGTLVFEHKSDEKKQSVTGTQKLGLSFGTHVMIESQLPQEPRLSEDQRDDDDDDDDDGGPWVRMMDIRGIWV
ncbi:hypothetical protein DUI87_17857 [Hirundo rustica rustica]|uniref:Uncharacterized protein n=1 Tax=Hirundo rustica rustica TaxID=333673 RepID=A0A3M0KBY0_HIRRU|nr:hypothetical protein DUI87_17857 [Hirundo rustica rustica]